MGYVAGHSLSLKIRKNQKSISFWKNSMLLESIGSGEHNGIRNCRVHQVLEAPDAEQVGRKSTRVITKHSRKNPPRGQPDIMVLLT